MEDDKYEYCRIFIRAGHLEVRGVLARVLEQDFSTFGHMETTERVSVDVRENEDAAANAQKSDFIRWPTTAEFEAQNGVRSEVVLNMVSKILLALWDSGTDAVAACDFEDELPWAGGIQRL